MVEDLSGVVERHELALQHHRSAVRDTVHHIQVVRDQDVGQAQLGLQLARDAENNDLSLGQEEGFTGLRVGALARSLLLA